MKTLAKVELVCTAPGTARDLASVLGPDNVKAPRGVAVTMKASGPRLSLLVVADSHSTAISTALAVLKDVALFEEIRLLAAPGDAVEAEDRGR